MDTIMKRRRHTPEQAVRKIREGERLLNEGQDLVEVLCHLEATFNRWRAICGGTKADEAWYWAGRSGWSIARSCARGRRSRSTPQVTSYEFFRRK